MHILYAAGPGDVVKTFERWRNRLDDTTGVAIAYSAQFYDVCSRIGATACVLSTHHDKCRLVAGQFRFVQAPMFGQRGNALTFYLGQLAYALNVMSRAVLTRADVVIISTGMLHFLLWPLVLLGIEVIPSLHNTFWPANSVPCGSVRKTQLLLQGWFWRYAALGTVCVSPEISRQVHRIARHPKGSVLVVRPQYRSGVFKAISPPPDNRHPFVVLFAGRIEESKGVLQLLNVAQQLESARPDTFHFHVCGEGSLVAKLRQQAQSRGLGGVFHILGHLDQADMIAAYGRSHVVIVPTTQAYAEGLNKVVVEAVLAGRPVISSAICPSLEIVRNAVLLARPCESDYRQAIERLHDDTLLYQQLQSATAAYRHDFFEPAFGWSAAVESLLRMVANRRRLMVRPRDSCNSLSCHLSAPVDPGHDNTEDDDQETSRTSYQV